MSFKLNGTKVRIGSNEIMPFILPKYDGSDIELFNGFEAPILQSLVKFMNITVEMIECEGIWGTKIDDTWYGIVGKLIDREIDIGFGGITVNSARNDVIRFGYPHFISAVTFTTNKPDRLGYSSSLLGPFEDKIWFCLISLVLIVFLFSLCFKQNIRISSIIRWSVISIILSQPIHSFGSKYYSIRILILSWLLSVFILKNYYCGELFGLMAVTTEAEKMETIDALATALRMGRIRVLGLGPLYANIKIRDVDLSEEEGQKYKHEDFDFVELVNNPKKYAMIQERKVLEYNIGINNFPHYLPPPHKDSNIFLELQAIALPKGSILEPEVDRCLSYLRDAGLLEYWKEHFYMVTFKRFGSREYFNYNDEFDELNFSQLLYAFKIFAFGCCGALHPFFYVNYNSDKTKIESLEAYEGLTLQTLSKYLNFTFEIIDCGMKWGEKQDDGSWNGIIGAVYDGRAQLGLAGVGVTAERASEPAIRFSYPYYFTTATFTAPLPKRIDYSSSLLGPFENMIWYSLLSLILMSFIISFIFERIFRDISQIRWTIISIILSQSINSLKLKLISVRIIICVWILSVFILKNYYCGDLFGLMTSHQFDKIETIDDFVIALKTNKLKVLTFSTKNLYLMKIQDLDLLSEEGRQYLGIFND